MHPFDIIVLTILGVFAIIGIRKGLVEELLKIIGLIAAIIIAANFVHFGAELLANFFNTIPGKMTVLSFIVIFLLTMLAFRILIALIKGILRFAMLGWLDRTGGAAFGTVKGAILLSAFLWLLILLPTGDFIENLERDSKSYPMVKGVVPALYNVFQVAIPSNGTFIEKFRGYVSPQADIENFDNLSKDLLIQRIQDELGRRIDKEILEGLSRDTLIELLKNPELLDDLREQLQEGQLRNDIVLTREAT